MSTIIELGCSYFPVPPEILTLNARLTILTALSIYQKGRADFDTGWDTPYRRRHRNNVARELVEKGIITEDLKPKDLTWSKFGGSRWGLRRSPKVLEGSWNPKDPDWVGYQTTRPDRIVLPQDFDYDGLSLAALKTYIGIFRHLRYQRKSKDIRWYSFVCSQEELATVAGLTRKNLYRGLKELALVNLIRVTTAHRKKSKYILLDPKGSGVEASALAQESWALWGKVPTFAKYNQMFGLDLTGAVGSFQMRCPFCKSKDKEFQLDTRDEAEGGDQWKCHKCGVAGTTRKLFAAWICRNRSETWQQMLRSALVDGNGEVIGIDDTLSESDLEYLRRSEQYEYEPYEGDEHEQQPQ